MANASLESLKHLSKSLQRVHRLFLENERRALEAELGHAMTPVEFFNRLTQDPALAWMKMFSSLIVEIDDFMDKAKKEGVEITEKNLGDFRTRVDFTLLNPSSKVAARYRQQLMSDSEFVLAHAEVRVALGPPKNND
jgi:hypothetical protein